MATFQFHLYQGDKWDNLSDNIVIDDITETYCKVFKIDIDNFGASQELSERISALIHCTSRTYEDIQRCSDEIAEKYGFECGIALPSISNTDQTCRAPILADGTPFSHVRRLERLTEMAQRLRSEGKIVRNSWKHQGDRTISVIQTTDGPMALWEYHAGNRHRKWIDGLACRMDSLMTTEAELKAVELLKTKITPSQFRCYILNGSFPEQSKKSDLHYFFRKGLPILAVSWHGAPQGRIIAALCLHPYGYYEYTHAGVMTPTDEVIAQLMLMRASEKKLWAKSGQWGPDDPRSGL